MTLMCIVQIQTSSKDARAKVIEVLSVLKDYAEKHEPRVYKYCITVPRDDDGTTIYMTDEYADSAAFEEHMTVPPIADMAATFTASPDLFAAPMKMHKLETCSSYTRSNIDEFPDPFIVFGSLSYTEKQHAETALTGFGKVGAWSEANEPGTLSYNVLRDPEEEKMVRTMEVYENEACLWDPHAKSDAVQDNIKVQGNTRIGRDLVFLRKVNGYFKK